MFHIRWFMFTLGSFGTLCKISDVKVTSLNLEYLQNSWFSSFVESTCMAIRGKQKMLLFWQAAKFEDYSTLKGCHLCYIYLSTNLFHLAKRQTETEGSWVSCLNFDLFLELFNKQLIAYYMWLLSLSGCLFGKRKWKRKLTQELP